MTKPFFVPAPAAVDTLELFTAPDKWAQARSQIAAFGLYFAHLYEDQHPEYGRVHYRSLCAVNAFALLKEWGVPLALEIGAVKPQACDGKHYANEAKDCIRRIEAAGGELAYLVIDEPLVSGKEFCQQDQAVTVVALARYIRDLRAFRPNLKVIWTEAWPFSRGSVIADVLMALMHEEAVPDGLHLDIDRYAVRDKGIARHEAKRDLQALQQLCGEFRIPLGILAWGQRVSTDAEYRKDVLRWIQPDPNARWPVAWANHPTIAPDYFCVQSFEERGGPGGSKNVPANLSETNAVSHTAVLLEFAKHTT